MKLLLAEDEKDMAAALVVVLEHSGYEVDAVRDGRAALALAHKGTYARAALPSRTASTS